MNRISDVPQWFAIRTRYRGEKLAKLHLEKKGIQVFLPLRTYSRAYQRKIKHYEVPLLPCFLFVRITRKEYVAVLDTPLVLGFVRIAQDIFPVRETEMQILRQISGISNELTLHEGPFEVGQQVYINQGPLYGLEGQILKLNSRERFLIRLESVPFALSMEVDRKTISRVSDRQGALAQ